jgi:hypothetical protein
MGLLIIAEEFLGVMEVVGPVRQGIRIDTGARMRIFETNVCENVYVATRVSYVKLLGRPCAMRNAFPFPDHISGVCLATPSAEIDFEF